MGTCLSQSPLGPLDELLQLLEPDGIVRSRSLRLVELIALAHVIRLGGELSQLGLRFPPPIGMDDHSPYPFACPLDGFARGKRGGPPGECCPTRVQRGPVGKAGRVRLSPGTHPYARRAALPAAPSEF